MDFNEALKDKLHWVEIRQVLVVCMTIELTTELIHLPPEVIRN